ncbi:unnamed protein product [Cyprideis torosa]|uniref:peptidylprolyl isomerase n=1 Tax=Cyprideis torosa TaxID=163714 RepID=A0A7R8WHF8_9CRUS|nr:unnamed protein product [Cyprideis torosa]CAG0899351.1 unnamed protein product [Cyprideis torosa]
MVANPNRESEDAEILCDIRDLGRLRKLALTAGTISNFPIHRHVVEVNVLGPFACGYPARDNYHLVPGFVTGRVYFVIGDRDLTEGLDCAIEHMKIGETAKVFMDPFWAYGKLGRTPKTLLVRERRASDASAPEWSFLGSEIGLAFLGELARSSHSSDRIGVLINRGSCLHLLRAVDNGNHR